MQTNCHAHLLKHCVCRDFNTFSDNVGSLSCMVWLSIAPNWLKTRIIRVLFWCQKTTTSRWSRVKRYALWCLTFLHYRRTSVLADRNVQWINPDIELDNVCVHSSNTDQWSTLYCNQTAIFISLRFGRGPDSGVAKIHQKTCDRFYRCQLVIGTNL